MNRCVLSVFVLLQVLFFWGGQLCCAQQLVFPTDTLAASVVSSDYIKRKGAEYVVYVRHNPEAQDKSLLEFMNTLPGVDGLSINGQDVSLVYVNGREMKMDPAELSKYLRGINAQDVKTIRILPFAGAAYRADHKGGVIRIQLKTGDNSRGSGNITSPVSIYSYNAGVVADPSFSYNYVKNNFSSYSYADMHYTQKGKEVQERVTELNGNKEWQDCSRGLTYFSLDQSMGYAVNDRHRFGFAIAGTYKPFEENNYRGMEDSEVSHFIKTSDDLLMYQSSLTYTLSYGDMGSELRIGSDYFGLRQDQSQLSDYSGSIVQQQDLTKDGLWSVTSDLIHIIGEGTAILNAGLFYRKMNAELGYGYGTKDHSFIYSESNYGAYADVLKDFMDGAVSTDFGLRLETLDMCQIFSGNLLQNNKYDFCKLFPSASISYNPSEKTSTSFSYRRNVDWPNMMTYSPVVYQDGLNQYHSGINDAKPVFGHNITLSETLNNKHIISLSADWKKRMFDSYFQMKGNDLYKSYGNVGDSRVLKLYLNSSDYFLKKRMKYTITADAKYAHYAHDLYGITNSISFSVSPRLAFFFDNKWRFAVSGNYSSPKTTPTYRFGENWTVSCNAWKTFNNHFYMNISLIDLLRKKSMKMESTVPGVQYSCDVAPYYRRVEVNVVYKFGNKNIRANQTVKDYELMGRAVNSNN